MIKVTIDPDYNPYTAKPLSGKNFAVGMQMTIHGRTFIVALLITSHLA